MAQYTITLRELIYQKTQEMNPLANIQGLSTSESVTAYRPENYVAGTGGRYPFFKQQNYPSIEERIEQAMPKILHQNLQFATPDFQSDFWNAFCAEFLMREIEYPTVAVFILKLNARLKMMLPRYNVLYNAVQQDIEPYITYRESTDRGLNEKIDRDDKGNSKQDTVNNGKQVFEDTPQNSILNTDYATNITTNNNSGNVTNNYTDNQNTDRNVSEGILKEGFNRPKIELLDELFEKMQDLVMKMVHDVGDPLFLKIY